MNKKIFAILFVLICALSISAVSAADDTGAADIAAIADDSNNDVISPVGTETTITLTGDNVTYGNNLEVQGTTTNIPNDAEITVTVNDVEKTFTTPITVTDDAFTIDLGNDLTVGTYKIVTSYAGDGTSELEASSATITLNVNPIATSIALAGENATYGKDVVITGTTTDIPDDSVIEVYVDGTKQTETTTTVTSNEFTVTLKDLDVGVHNITTKFAKTATLANSTAQINITVLPVNTTIAVSANKTIVAGQDLVVNGTVANITDGSKVTITINATGATPVEATVADGKFTATIKDLTEGNYTVTATFAGNETHKEASAKANVTVEAAPVVPVNTSIAITANATVTAGEDVVVNGTVTNITDGAKITITINATGATPVEVEVADGKFTTTIKDLEAGNYTITAKFDGNATAKESNATAKVTVEAAPAPVVPVNTSIAITANATVTAGDDVVVNGTVTNITDGAKITITINATGATPVEATVADGKFTTTIKDLEAGNYTITAKFDGNATAKESNATAKVTVEAAPAPVVPVNTSIAITANATVTAGDDVVVNGTVTNITEGSTITISVNDTASTTVTATVDADGKFTATIADLEAGNYTITAKFDGNATAKESNATAKVTVEAVPVPVKNTTAITVSATNATLGELVNITGTVTNITDGSIIGIYLGNDFITNATVKDGKFNATYEPVDAGKITIVAKFDGNESYDAATASANATVKPAPVEPVNTTIAITANATIKSGEALSVNGTVENITDGAEITISVNDTASTTVTAVVKDGKFNATIANLAAGNYTITAKFAGNDTAKAANATAKVTVEAEPTPVEPVNTTIAIKVNATVVAGENVTVEGTVENITDGAEITISVNDTAATTVTATVADGKFTATIEGLTKGNYTVTASFAGNATAKAATATANVTVTPAPKANTTIKVENITADYGEDVNVTITTENIPDGAKVNVTIGSVSYVDQIVNNNTVSIALGNKTAAGTYDIKVSYAGDEDHNAAAANATLVVRSIPTIEIDAIPKKELNEDVTVTGNTTGLADGTELTITATINGTTKNYTTTVTNNTFKQDLGNISAEGTLEITVVYKGNETVAAADAIATVTIGKDTASIVADNVTVKVNETAIITGIMVPANANITITIGNKTYNATADDTGAFTVAVGTFDKAGNYTATIAYPGNENYTATTATATITVTKIGTGITVSDVEVDATENITISGTTENIPENATITITVGDLITNATVKDNKFSVTVDPMAKGNYTIDVAYEGDADYDAANATANLTVKGIDTSIAIDNVTVFVDEKFDIIATTTGFENNTKIEIVITVDGIPIKENVTVVDNKINLTSLFDIAGYGKMNYTVSFPGDNVYNECEANFTVTINRYPTTTTIVNITEFIQAGENVKVNATVVDSNGTAVQDGNASIYINGKLVETQAVVNGTVIFDLANVTAGNKTVTVVYEGTDYYDASNATATVEINGTDITLTVPDVTKYFKNDTQMVISLTSNGTGLTGEKVLITINGETYTRTITNGTAIFKINLNPGVYHAVVEFESLKYNPAVVNVTVTVLSTISSEDLVMYYKNGSKFNANFTDAQGNPLNGTAKFNINGVIYDRKVTNGTTSGLALNLNPGEYTITAINELNGEMKSFNVTILSTIIAENLTMYYKNGSKFNAVFLDGQGNPLNGSETKAQFNINGVFYNRGINENGTTSGLALNLNPGEYVITVIAPNGEMKSFTIIILPDIIAEDFTTPFQGGLKYRATAIDGQGKPQAGVNLTFNINGIMYYRTTNESGVSGGITINLVPGEYIMTVMREDTGAMVSKTVTVTPPA